MRLTGTTVIGNILAMTPKWIEPIKLDTSVRAYVTARGDVGDSPYSGFNPCHYTGDSPEHVDGCRKKLADYLGVSTDAIVLPRQTHSSRCKIIERIPVVADDIYGVDAVVTRLCGVAIGVSTADCVPILLVDPEAGVIGAVHAGWRGAAGGVVENAIAAMISIGAVPARIKAAMGPCICVDCFEVGEEVAAQFPESCVMRGFPKPHVDLPGYVAGVLTKCGVMEGNISMPGKCTRCFSDRYFSARALGVNSGRNFTFIMS